MTRDTPSEEANEVGPGSRRRPRRQLRVEELMVFLGNKQAIRLCAQYGGLVLPTLDRLYRRLRREAVIAERNNWGTPVGELAAKYNLQPASVRRFLTEHRRQMREMKRDNRLLEAARRRRDAA